MKRYPVLLLATLGISTLTFAQTPAPVPAADPVIQSIANSPDPSAAVAAYASAVHQVGPNNLLLEDAYVRRMVTFNLPDLADAQAQDVIRQDPNNAVARAVVAYAQGRKNQPFDALASIVQAAAPQPNTPDDTKRIDPFVLRTAGQLIAWYDTRADKSHVPNPLKNDIESTRRRLFPEPAYIEAYNSAHDLYAGNAAQPQPQPQAQPVQPQPAAPQPTYASPAATYDDGYAYQSTTTYPDPYYYPATSYWTPTYSYYGYYGYNSYYPGYFPPTYIDHHRHDHEWDHGHDGDHGHDHDHDGNHDHDGHDGHHEPHPSPAAGGLPGHHIDDPHTSPNHNDRIVAPEPASPHPVIIPQIKAQVYQQSEAARSRPSEPTVTRHVDAPAAHVEAPHAAPVRSAPAPAPTPHNDNSNNGGGGSSSRGNSGGRSR